MYAHTHTRLSPSLSLSLRVSALRYRMKLPMHVYNHVFKTCVDVLWCVSLLLYRCLCLSTHLSLARLSLSLSLSLALSLSLSSSSSAGEEFARRTRAKAPPSPFVWWKRLWGLQRSGLQTAEGVSCRVRPLEKPPRPCTLSCVPASSPRALRLSP